MSEFSTRIRPHVTRELEQAADDEARGEPELAFHHLERAHVLGQASTREHVRVHWAMLRFGLRRRSLREVAGQVVRIVGAATKTGLGLVPSGNTGGANVSAFRPLPVPSDLQAILDEARGTGRSDGRPSP
jgi:hypothetical protein